MNSGGTAYAPVIGNSGTLILNTGATAVGGIVFSGAAAVLDIAGLSLPVATISCFAVGDAIDLESIAPGGASATLNITTDVLTIASGGSAYALNLSGNYSGMIFQVASNRASGSLLTVAVPCFAAGTRIATARGSVAVETLSIDEHAMLHDGGTAPIKWIGHRHVDCARHPNPRQVWPVRVRAGAFGDGMPCRDLWLSPDHAVFVGTVLIPIKYLINAVTIEQVPVNEITYYHVELPGHDVLLAEGLPVESYLDTGDRSNFANGGGPVALYPDFSVRMWRCWAVRRWSSPGLKSLRCGCG